MFKLVHHIFSHNPGLRQICQRNWLVRSSGCRATLFWCEASSMDHAAAPLRNAWKGTSSQGFRGYKENIGKHFSKRIFQLSPCRNAQAVLIEGAAMWESLRSFVLIKGGGEPNRLDESLGVKYYEARTVHVYLFAAMKHAMSLLLQYFLWEINR